jgi:hypothetical protein
MSRYIRTRSLLCTSLKWRASASRPYRKSRYPPTAAPVALLSTAVTQLPACHASAAFRTSKPIPPSISRPHVAVQWPGCCSTRPSMSSRASLCGRCLPLVAPRLPSAVSCRHAPLLPGSPAHLSRRSVSARESHCIVVRGPPSAPPPLHLILSPTLRSLAPPDSRTLYSP